MAKTPRHASGSTNGPRNTLRKAMNKPLGWRVPNTIPWYVDVFRPLFSEIAVLCGTDNLRRVNMALFSYGARQLPFSD